MRPLVSRLSRTLDVGGANWPIERRRLTFLAGRSGSGGSSWRRMLGVGLVGRLWAISGSSMTVRVILKSSFVFRLDTKDWTSRR